MKLFQKIIIFSISLLLICRLSYAQFKGDVYFQPISVTAEVGATVELPIVAFTGSTPLGATHIEVEFDPSKAEVLSVLPGKTVGKDKKTIETFVTYKSIPGKTSLIALNKTSLSNPFGTVEVARLQVKPLLSSGELVYFNINVIKLLNTKSETFDKDAGFSGDIVAR
jgi:hypothetical protein